MPDQWGRVGINDWMGMTSALNGFQKMNQRNTEYKQGQADRAELKADQGQYQTALGGFGETGELPEGTRPDIGVQVKQTHAQGLRADESIADTKRKTATQEKLTGLLSWRQQNPDRRWDDVPLDLYSGADGMAAYALAIDREAQTEQGQTTIMKNRLARADVALKQFNDAKQYINTSMSNGDTQNAVNALEKLTKDLPVPYRLKGYDEGAQTLNVEYLDSHTGQHQKSGTKSLKEALQQVYNTGEKEFVGGMAQNMEAVRQGNLKYRQDPIRGKGQNGREYLIIPQKKPQEPSKVDIEVRDSQTNEKIMFDSWESLNNAGIYKEDLGRDKKVADISNTIAAGKKAATRQYIRIDESTREPVLDSNGNPQILEGTPEQISQLPGGGGGFELYDNIKTGTEQVTDTAKAGTAQVDKYSKQLSFLLKPFFNQAAGITFNTGNDGMFEDPAAKNAYTAGTKFYEDNKVDGTARELNGRDQSKFDNVAAAIQIFKDMSKDISGQYLQPLTAMQGPTGASASKYGKRNDGTEKGSGFFGDLPLTDGSNRIATEISVGVNINGKEVEIPTLVPGLSDEQKAYLLDGGKPTKEIVGIAVASAKKRMSKGKPPFAQDGESQQQPGTRRPLDSYGGPASAAQTGPGAETTPRTNPTSHYTRGVTQ